MKIEPTPEWSESRATEIGAHPERYEVWKAQFQGWTKREEEIAHAAYIAGWYHRCNQDPDAML